MRNLLFFVLSLLFSSNILAETVINEIMVNEPEGYTSLEWIELYNNSDTSIDLQEYQLSVNGSLFSFPAYLVASQEYLLIVRKLFKGGGITSFESFWGNDSDIWGDNDFEATITEPIEVSFSLSNSSGTIQLLMNSMEVSSFSWDDAGSDGISIERLFPDSIYFEQSVARDNSTPGRINSVTPLPFDISLDSVKPYFNGRNSYIIVSLTNRSLDSLLFFNLIITNKTYYSESYYVPQNYFPFIGTVVETLYVNNPIWMYESLEAYLNFSSIADDRPENDTLQFVAVGVLYPPLVISEFLASPPNAFEWVEIFNSSDSIIDFANWSLGDAIDVELITDSTILIFPNEYVVVTEDESMFRENYINESENLQVIEINSWRTLNNDSDSIQLVDMFGITADILYYDITDMTDFAYGRRYPIAYSDQIYRSETMFGTPGFENILFTYAQNDNIQIRLSSKYFVYDSEPLVIKLAFPEADSYSIKIYNKDGQLVSVLAEETELVFSTIEWNGETMTGKRLPIGIYILVVEAAGVVKAKETFVVAR